MKLVCCLTLTLYRHVLSNGLNVIPYFFFLIACFCIPINRTVTMAIMLFRHFWNCDVIFTLGLYGVLTIGDWFQGQNIALTYKALADNVTHCVIGLITWVIVILGSERIGISHWFEVLCCGVCASMIDVDHFIAAGSLNLKDATNLSSRPFLHCTSVPVLVCTLLIALTSMCKLTLLHRYSWVLLAAFLSHHIRDAYRRGFWMWPFGSTAPLSYPLYIISIIGLPFTIKYGLKAAEPDYLKPTVQIWQV